MQVQSSEAPLDAHVAGTFLQPLGFHVIAEESYESEQYSPVAHVAVPQVAPPVAGGVVAPDVPDVPDVPDDVPVVDEEQAATAKATAAKVEAERRELRSVMAAMSGG